MKNQVITTLDDLRFQKGQFIEHGHSKKSNYTDLKTLFYPHSVAVIGATNTQGKIGYNVFKNLLSHNYDGKLFPVNPNTDVVQGIKTFKSIADIPDEVDEAIIIVPARQTPEIVRQCCNKGVKFIVNEVAGYSEIGAEGRSIEIELKQILKKSGSRMLGPTARVLLIPTVTWYNHLV